MSWETKYLKSSSYSLLWKFVSLSLTSGLPCLTEGYGFVGNNLKSDPSGNWVAACQEVQPPTPPPHTIPPHQNKNIGS